MDISKATLSDLSELAVMNMEVHRLHVAAHPDFFKDLSLDSIEECFRQFLRDDECKVFVGRHEGKTVGYMVLQLKHQPENPFQKAAKWLYIDHIGVKQKHRGSGFGKKFLEFAAAFARSENVDRLILDVWDFNEEARAFFASQGFRPWIGRMEMTL
jgi:ribosomal protein S18 acetylase RimI-like enzyme